MADNIRITVELKEGGTVTLKDYLKQLEKTESATAKVKKQYKDLSNDVVNLTKKEKELWSSFSVTNQQFEKQTAITKTLQSVINNAITTYQNLGIVIAGDVVGAYKKFSNELIRNNSEILKAQALNTNIASTIRKASSDYTNLSSIIAGNVVDAYKKFSAELNKNSSEVRRNLAQNTSVANTVRQVAGEYNKLGTIIAGDVVGNFKKAAIATYKAEQSLKQAGVQLDQFAAKAQKAASSSNALWVVIKTKLALGLDNLRWRLIEAGKSALQLSSDFQGYRNALAVAAEANLSITERIASANEQLNSAIGLAEKYKLDIISVTKSYSKFVNALSIAGVELNKANVFYENFAKFARVANLSAQAQTGIFLALEQMVSKGVVSMEELRRQLGEYLPGAVNIAAQSMGMATDEFISQVTKGQINSIELIENLGNALSERVEPLVASSLQKYSANLTALNNQWIRLKVTLGDFATAILNPILETLTSLLKVVNSFVTNVDDLDNAINQVTTSVFGTSEAMTELRKATGDFSSDQDVVVEKAKALSEELKENSFAAKDVTTQFGLLGIGLLGITGATTALTAPFKILFGLFVKFKNIIAPATTALAAFASRSIWGKLVMWIGKLGLTFKKLTIIGAITGLITALGFKLYDVWKASRDASDGVDKTTKSLTALEVKAKLGERTLKGYAKALKEIDENLEGLSRSQAIVALDVAKAAKEYGIAKQKLEEFQRTQQAGVTTPTGFELPAGPFATELPSAFEIASEQAEKAETKLKGLITGYQGLVDVQKSVNDVTKLTAEEQEDLDKLIVDLTFDIAELQGKLRPGTREIAELGRVSSETKEKLFELFELKDKLEKQKQLTKETNKTTKAIDNFAKSLKRQQDALAEQAAGRTMLSTEVEAFNSALKFSNNIIEINKLKTKDATKADRERIEVLKEQASQLFRGQVAEIQPRIDVEKIQRKTEELELTRELAREQEILNQVSRPEIIQAENQFTAEKIALLKEQISVLQNIPGSELAVKKLEIEIVKLSQTADLAGQKLQDIVEGSFNQFFNDIISGTKSWGDALRGLFINILQGISQEITANLAKMAVKFIAGLGGGGAAGGANVFTTLGGILFGGGAATAANGGSFNTGDNVLVGERGPELVQFRQPGTVIPNNQMNNQMNEQRPSFNIINFVDKDQFKDWLQSNEGQDSLVNVVNGNREVLGI